MNWYEKKEKAKQAKVTEILSSELLEVQSPDKDLSKTYQEQMDYVQTMYKH